MTPKDPIRTPISQTGGGDYVPLLSAAQVAGWLGCTKSWVYRLAQQGDLKVVRLGKLVRFERTEVSRLIEAGGIPPIKARKPQVDLKASP